MKNPLLRVGVGIACLFLVACTQHSTGAAPNEQDKEEILELLGDQVACWNQGDIPCFMETYWRNDSLLFITRDGAVYGWDRVMQNYLEWYPTPERMGTLSFEVAAVKLLSAEYAHVLGEFHLALGEDRESSGTFTLLWQKIDGDWKIIQDHTS